MEEIIKKRIDNYNSEIELLDQQKKEIIYVKQIRLINKARREYIRLRDLEQDKLDKMLGNENIS
jgi:hypothetical protein